MFGNNIQPVFFHTSDIVIYEKWGKNLSGQIIEKDLIVFTLLDENSMSIEVEKGEGKKYLKEMFDIEIED